MVTPICEEPLCRIICIFLFFFFSSPSSPPPAFCFPPPLPLITAPQMKGVLFDSVLIIQLQSNNSTLQEERREREKKKSVAHPTIFLSHPLHIIPNGFGWVGSLNR